MKTNNSGGTMSEQQVLPELDVKGWTGKKCPACEGTGEAGDEKFGNCTSCAGTGDEYSNIHCRERQLLTTLASLAQSEAERERLQGELEQSKKCLDEIPSGLKLHGLYVRGTPNSIIQVSDAFNKIAAWHEEAAKLTAELAREREANQGLREVLKEYRECKFKISHKESCCFRGLHDCRCDCCINADAMLEPKAKPVATTS